MPFLVLKSIIEYYCIIKLINIFISDYYFVIISVCPGELAQVVVGSASGRDILLVLYSRSRANLTKASGQLDMHKETCDHRSMAELGQCLLEGSNHTDLMDILRSMTRELKADVLTDVCDVVREDLLKIMEEGNREGEGGDTVRALVEEFLRISKPTKASRSSHEMTAPLLL